MAVTAGVVFVGATAIQQQEEKKRAERIEEAQEETAAVERAIQGEQSARARRQQIKQARIARADIENIAAVTGQEAGSAAVSGAQATTGTAASNIGAIQKQTAGQAVLSRAQSKLFSEQNAAPSDLSVAAGTAKQVASIFV